VRKKLEKVPEIEETCIEHYSPHRGVKDNSTTNTRPVFNAVCKSILNDRLSEGLNRHELVPQIMFRFRFKMMSFPT
jgi:hypothetical protein